MDKANPEIKWSDRLVFTAIDSGDSSARPLNVTLAACVVKLMLVAQFHRW